MSLFKPMPPTLQESEKNILISLAEKGPSWHYRLWKDREAARSNTTISKGLRALRDKGLIREYDKRQPSGSEGWRGRNKLVYCATKDGLILALFHGADPDLVLRQAVKQKTIGNELEFLAEVTKLLGKKHTMEFFNAMRRGELYTKMPKSERKMKKFRRLLAKLPRYEKAIEYGLEAALKAFRDCF